MTVTPAKILYQPIHDATWPPDQAKPHRSGQFKSTRGATLKLIRQELGRLGVREAVIELDVTGREVRVDGLMRAYYRVRSPRVRLSFKHPQVGPLQYPCSTYNSHEHNLRAIALTLGAQRAMDRYGATRRGQQYTGWKALPGGSSPEVAMTVDVASNVVRRIGGGNPQEIRNSAAEYRACYIRAVKACHPDTNGAEFTKDFQQLQEAKRVLDQHHGAGL